MDYGTIWRTENPFILFTRHELSLKDNNQRPILFQRRVVCLKTAAS